ncbi:MAG TPA: hypothetical protein VNP36_22310 [Burkholderiales bacterium]|nr:hypothetical protein [Burkholderiales bacterium]
MKRLFLRLLLWVWVAVSGCAQPPSAGVVITNAPGSLGNCMPEKPAGGCP